MEFKNLEKFDKEIYDLIKSEEQKQQYKLSMIPSENFTLPAVRETLSSVFVHKYAEWESWHRYYEWNQFVDQVEDICKQRVRKVFWLDDWMDVNVQPLSWSNANLWVYNWLLKFWDTILSMFLPDWWHLSHWWSLPGIDQDGLKWQTENQEYLWWSKKVSIVSKIFNIVQYKVEKETQIFDYEKIRMLAHKYMPKMIITWWTAYPREIDYKKISQIAKEIWALYLADISHEAWLIAAWANKSPVWFADIITFTTHKTLRWPRWAIILSKKEYSSKINSWIFPWLQWWPFLNVIASICVCLKDVDTQEFKIYANQIVKNAQTIACELQKFWFNIVSWWTDKHLVLIDLRNKWLTWKNIAKALDLWWIIVNRNSVPFETGSPMNPSWLRIWTPTITTRWMKENEMILIANWINEIVELVKDFANLKTSQFLDKIDWIARIKQIQQEVKALCEKFPLEI